MKRQLEKYLEGKEPPPEMRQLFDAISQFYYHTDRDREVLERAMEISSEELMQTNRKLRAELEEKLLAQQKAREHELMLKSINKNVHEAISRRTLKGDLIFANESFLELFGFDSSEELKKIPPEELYTNPADRRRVLEILTKEDTLRGFEVSFRKKNGEVFWGLLTAALVQDQDGKFFLDSAIVDITPIKKTEKMLRETNEMLRKTNEELDRFVYSASHDLRAPLMSLLGLIKVIELEKDRDIDQHLEMMKRSITRLDVFINDIINYSQNSRLHTEIQLVDFHFLLSECFDQLQYLPSAARVKKTIELSIPTPFYSDPKRLSVVFNNLLSNAINYHNPFQPEPFIKVQVETNEFDCRIDVIDNGKGIRAEHQPKIFNMFYRANEEAKGSGLGLYIVKEIIDKLDGTIVVESNPGAGTKFTIRLPNMINIRQPMHNSR
ncbi:MAG TPA: PAS domain-containing sensor histidine kinase [Chryseosolibacter sp.]|nr:PAS domain-containing sensor histidine kinase [Chryseosolibacter sp.]